MYDEYTDSEILDMVMQDSHTETVEELMDFISRSFRKEVEADLLEINNNREVTQ